MSPLLRLLGSHRLALVLLGVSGLTVILGGTLPQSARLSPGQREGWQTQWSTLSVWLESLRLSDIFGSGWFLLLVAALVVNLTAGLALCGASSWRLAVGRAPPRHVMRGQGDLPAGGMTPLGRLGSRSGTLREGVVGLLGLPLLHLGLLWIVTGGLASAAFGFGAYIELTQGEVYAGEPDKLTLARGIRPRAFAGRLRLDGTEIAVDGGRYLRELRATLTFQRDGAEIRRAVVRANQPLEFGDYRLYPDNRFGYSAIVDRILPDGTHRLLLINFPLAKAEWGQRWEVSRRGVELPGERPLSVPLKLSGPDAPLFYLGEGATLDQPLHPGDAVDLAGSRWQFRGIAPWMGFYLTRDPAQPWVFVGFAMTGFGFLLYLLSPFRRLAWRSDATGWELRLWSGRGDCRMEAWWQMLGRAGRPQC